ncbi:uncharacterized protein LOC117808937, partial [Notolabrus celidotus]|uniref:uncharacterized protein LOC117808937 n=1 Tax=Notolabrus celidotus TaxID=1203425 RepID=UPI00149036DF
MRPAVSRVQWILSSTVAKETERQDHLLHRGGDDGPGEDGLSVPESGSWVDLNLCFVVLGSAGVGPQTSACTELRQPQDWEQVEVSVGYDEGRHQARPPWLECVSPSGPWVRPPGGQGRGKSPHPLQETTHPGPARSLWLRRQAPPQGARVEATAQVLSRPGRSHLERSTPVGLRVRSGSRWLDVLCQVLPHSGDGRRRVRCRDILEVVDRFDDW